MTPMRAHAQYSHLPPSEGRHSRQVYLHPFFPTYKTSSVPPSSSSFLSTCQGGPCERDHQQHKVDQQFPSSGSIDRSSLWATIPPPAKHEHFSHNATTSAGDLPSSGPGKWMSSKMRFMRKMMNSDGIDGSKPRKSAQLALQDDQQQAIIRGTKSGSNNSNSAHYCVPSGAPVRVCSDCNTTKTPLWRSGPRGPKSLCNACGIRQRKARRAMAAAALTGGVIPAVTPAKVPKEKKQQGECAVPFKKRCKFGTAETRKELHVDEFTRSFGKNNPAFHRVFPQDEKEAAMLLMALSCGLLRG
ncbi:hypothetical protein Taro_017140 [Colocasia esculenta]|uniref:GATA-type domain-containing protein n=1 Tax=Colocasia esculenta TaxID=4460 RepID=A0A843UFJ7_COLES|nr:hypothetical protein [Colocasia esculenta]